MFCPPEELADGANAETRARTPRKPHGNGRVAHRGCLFAVGSLAGICFPGSVCSLAFLRHHWLLALGSHSKINWKCRKQIKREQKVKLKGQRICQIFSKSPPALMAECLRGFSSRPLTSLSKPGPCPRLCCWVTHSPGTGLAGCQCWGSRDVLQKVSEFLSLFLSR